MIIEIIPCLSDNYSYLINEKETNTISIVDPAEFNACDKVINKYKKLDYILNTHHHADHVGANLELKKKYNSKILGSDSDKDRIPGIDIFLKEKQKQKIGNLEFEIIFVPGHTRGHIACFFNKEKVEKIILFLDQGNMTDERFDLGINESSKGFKMVFDILLNNRNIGLIIKAKKPKSIIKKLKAVLFDNRFFS